MKPEEAKITKIDRGTLKLDYHCLTYGEEGSKVNCDSINKCSANNFL